MKKLIKTISIFVASIIMPAVAYADVNLTQDIPNAVKGPSLGQLIANVTNILFFVLGAGSVIAIIVGGIMFATSAGNADQAKKGREAVIYAVIGIVISLSALAITSFITRSLTK
jgi:hypothetical protein